MIHIKQIILITVLFIFTGCASSDLHYTKDTLYLTVDKTSLDLQGTEVASKRNNFSILFLNQKQIRLKDGSIIVYENARTDMRYEFATTPQRIVKYLFDAKQVIELYGHASLYAYQVILVDNSVLNLIVQKKSPQELTFLYGLNTQRFNHILHTLTQQNITAHYKHVIDLKTIKNPYLSTWSTVKINFIPLVRPVPRLRPF